MVNKSDDIVIHNARVHNLKNISLRIPKNKLTVITGPSGSGKSSLAFDTIFVEGQKRYIESLSSNTKQFVGEFQTPDVESITGLSPAIAIDQKTTHNNPRSTVGTITEVYDFFRILFSKIGILKCPETGVDIIKQSPQQIVEDIMKVPMGSKLHLLIKISPTKASLKVHQSAGHIRCLYQDEIIFIDDLPAEKNIKGDVYAVVDRIILKENSIKRITDSVDQALYHGKGFFFLYDEKELKLLTTKLVSPTTQVEFPKIEARLFSFNSPVGACAKCKGLGHHKKFIIGKMLDYDATTILNSIIPIKNKKPLQNMVETVLVSEGHDKKAALSDVSKKLIDTLFYGSTKSYQFKLSTNSSDLSFNKKYIGLVPWLEAKYKESTSDKERREIEKFMVEDICPQCQGTRLSEISRNVFINEQNISDFVNCSLEESLTKSREISLEGSDKLIGQKILDEIISRLQYLNEAGLEYLSLDRGANTLSGGEMQRIRLATQIGNSLSGVLYILDEPSIGLHPYDNRKLLNTLINIKNNDNTLIVVEHDEDMMRAADHIVDIGPKAGIHGGELMAQGTLNHVLKNKESLTAQYLNRIKRVEGTGYKHQSKELLTLKGATQNNLKNITLKLPLDGMTCITGVSGSGKSTLIHDVLVPAVKFHLTPHFTQYSRENFTSLTGVENLKSVIEIDQSAIGKSSKSNPATYTGLFDEVRKIFASLPESQLKGYSQGRFSFNVKDGRCEICEGHGVQKIDVNFLPNIFITCDRCKGDRYNDDTLKVRFKGLNISDVLNLTVDQAAEVFGLRKKIKRILTTMQSVGLGYIKLGQSSLSLSGGEAQRLKLSKELSKSTKGKCLYILDEPTTGLHFDDINTLLKTIAMLLEKGNPVVVIEHNLDVISHANHIIDLGPGGGSTGGKIVAQGSIDKIINSTDSKTGPYLKSIV